MDVDNILSLRRRVYFYGTIFVAILLLGYYLNRIYENRYYYLNKILPFENLENKIALEEGEVLDNISTFQESEIFLVDTVENRIRQITKDKHTNISPFISEGKLYFFSDRYIDNKFSNGKIQYGLVYADLETNGFIELDSLLVY